MVKSPNSYRCHAKDLIQDLRFANSLAIYGDAMDTAARILASAKRCRCGHGESGIQPIKFVWTSAWVSWTRMQPAPPSSSPSLEGDHGKVALQKEKAGRRSLSSARDKNKSQQPYTVQQVPAVWLCAGTYDEWGNFRTYSSSGEQKGSHLYALSPQSTVPRFLAVPRPHLATVRSVTARFFALQTVIKARVASKKQKTQGAFGKTRRLKSTRLQSKHICTQLMSVILLKFLNGRKKPGQKPHDKGDCLAVAARQGMAELDTSKWCGPLVRFRVDHMIRHSCHFSITASTALFFMGFSAMVPSVSWLSSHK